MAFFVLLSPGRVEIRMLRDPRQPGSSAERQQHRPAKAEEQPCRDTRPCRHQRYAEANDRGADERELATGDPLWEDGRRGLHKAIEMS
jgi:hypothetical protein